MSSYDFNKVILMGYVGNEPRCSAKDKKPFASISLATNKSYKQGDEVITETHWHNVVFFGTKAELVEQYVKKGSHLLVEGALENYKWHDKEGIERLSTKIVVRELRFLDKKEEEMNQIPEEICQPDEMSC